MADLSSIERRKLERLLRMGGGYVLDFSDRTFSEFFEEHTRRDIDAAVLLDCVIEPWCDHVCN